MKIKPLIFTLILLPLLLFGQDTANKHPISDAATFLWLAHAQHTDTGRIKLISFMDKSITSGAFKCKTVWNDDTVTYTYSNDSLLISANKLDTQKVGAGPDVYKYCTLDSSIYYYGLKLKRLP